MTRKHMTHASLFSGIGGFDLAAQWAGFENVFNCEKDSFCRQVLNYYFPTATKYGDIKTTDFTPWRGKIDILPGGFPCQPFSLAGKRKGTDDDRYLWPEMLRAISEIRPTWVIGENVGGIVSMVQPNCEVEVATQASLFGEGHYTTQERQGFIIEQICRDIENLGYCVQPILIPACGVGAPHRRDRVWFVAENTKRVRCDGGQSEEEPRAGGFGEFGARDHMRVRREATIAADCSNTGDETMRERGKHSDVAESAPDATGILLQGRENRSRKVKSGRGGGGSILDWEEFSTQSPVCGRDDGVSGELDGFTLPKWRMESIKAYGNAIVPQVALQIMEAIKENVKHDKT